MSKTKLCLIVFLLLVLGGEGAALFAQQNKTVSDYYPVKVFIEKVYAYRLGYVVDYRKGPRTERVFIPREWFSRFDENGQALATPPKAERFFTPRGALPYMSLYYKRGEEGAQFDHVRIYVPQNVQSTFWGYIRQGVDVDEDFAKAMEAGVPAIEYK